LLIFERSKFEIIVAISNPIRTLGMEIVVILDILVRLSKKQND